MGPLDLLNHGLNFTAPALWVAVWVTFFGRIFIRKMPAALSIQAQAAINFIACLVTLGLGLLIFGRDGKMLTYTAVALVGATSQWLLLRGWKA